MGRPKKSGGTSQGFDWDLPRFDWDVPNVRTGPASVLDSIQFSKSASRFAWASRPANSQEPKAKSRSSVANSFSCFRPACALRDVRRARHFLRVSCTLSSMWVSVGRCGRCRSEWRSVGVSQNRFPWKHFFSWRPSLLPLEILLLPLEARLFESVLSPNPTRHLSRNRRTRVGEGRTVRDLLRFSFAGAEIPGAPPCARRTVGWQRRG